MPDYSHSLMDSDLDAFKNSGQIRTASFVISGSLGAGAAAVFSATPFAVDLVDISQILFDNSIMHSGKYKSIMLEDGVTLVNETTFGSVLTVDLNIKITGNVIQLTGNMFNPYSSPVNLQATTINFRYIPYEATF